MKPTDQVLLFHAMRLAASVDGRINDEETALVHGTLAVLPDFEDLDVDALQAGSDALVEEFGGLLESAEALTRLKPMASRRKAYLLALEMAHASAGVLSIERTLLSMLRKLLRLDARVAKQMDTVVGWKFAGR
ncbi:MAG: TerB family tellurite resistance protein [Myxococcaceae bacterium]|nr:TerB family tellurite resistance protein [Myxococcaceae bacterium]